MNGNRVPVGTTVLTNWGPAIVTADLWPGDPNYLVTYTEDSKCPGIVGAFDHVTPASRDCEPAQS